MRGKSLVIFFSVNNNGVIVEENARLKGSEKYEPKEREIRMSEMKRIYSLKE